MSRIKGDSKALRVDLQQFDPAHHAFAFIYPYPLSHGRYFVVNSGFTFRDDALSSNAKQVPMLPDWAIIDVRTPPNGRLPGKIASAGFFNERWELPAKLPTVEDGR